MFNPLSLSVWGYEIFPHEFCNLLWVLPCVWRTPLVLNRFSIIAGVFERALSSSPQRHAVHTEVLTSDEKSEVEAGGETWLRPGPSCVLRYWWEECVRSSLQLRFNSAIWLRRLNGVRISLVVINSPHRHPHPPNITWTLITVRVIVLSSISFHASAQMNEPVNVHVNMLNASLS